MEAKVSTLATATADSMYFETSPLARSIFTDYIQFSDSFVF